VKHGSKCKTESEKRKTENPPTTLFSLFMFHFSLSTVEVHLFAVNTHQSHNTPCLAVMPFRADYATIRLCEISLIEERV
jgi:hypothetical protein